MNKKNRSKDEKKTPPSPSTTWGPVADWYGSIVGEKGHYYHEKVIFPNLLKLLNLKENDHLLDLACGQGVLSRVIPQGVRYTGVDIAKELVAQAQKANKKKNATFSVGDVTKPLSFETPFTHATIILAFQNFKNPKGALQNVWNSLEEGGSLAIVMNHPCFRIPRQSSWGVDKEKKLQYRRLDIYMSPLEIPIQAHPGKGKESVSTLSYHHSLQDLFGFLGEVGFMVEYLKEWCSDKVSEGGAAKQENRAREEFPLFLTLGARKISKG